MPLWSWYFFTLRCCALPAFLLLFSANCWILKQNKIPLRQNNVSTSSDTIHDDTISTLGFQMQGKDSVEIIISKKAEEWDKTMQHRLASRFFFQFHSQLYEKLKHLQTIGKRRKKKNVLFVSNKIVKWHVHSKLLNMFYIFLVFIFFFLHCLLKKNWILHDLIFSRKMKQRAYNQLC